MLDQKILILDNLGKDYVIPVLVSGFIFSYDFLTTEKVINLNMANIKCYQKVCEMLNRVHEATFYEITEFSFYI